jgi:hypothetical protein
VKTRDFFGTTNDNQSLRNAFSSGSNQHNPRFDQFKWGKNRFGSSQAFETPFPRVQTCTILDSTSSTTAKINLEAAKRAKRLFF